MLYSNRSAKMTCPSCKNVKFCYMCRAIVKDYSHCKFHTAVDRQMSGFLYVFSSVTDSTPLIVFPACFSLSNATL